MALNAALLCSVAEQHIRSMPHQNALQPTLVTKRLPCSAVSWRSDPPNGSLCCPALQCPRAADMLYAPPECPAVCPRAQRGYPALQRPEESDAPNGSLCCRALQYPRAADVLCAHQNALWLALVNKEAAALQRDGESDSHHVPPGRSASAPAPARAGAQWPAAAAEW